MRIRLLSPGDLVAVKKIQDCCGQAAAWGEADYARLAADPLGMVLVAEREKTVPPELLGFAALHRLGDDAELWNLAVAPQHRRRGIAQALFQEARQRLLLQGARRIFLEVRASNAPALGLYSKVGFQSFMRRKDYYQNPREDALVLACDLVPNPGD